MHVSQIDYPTFFEDALGTKLGVGEFVNCVQNLNGNEFSGKIALHQAARLIWLADRLEEEYAKGRDGLQILFFLMAAEAVAKIVQGYDKEGQSKNHVRIFFEEYCHDNAKQKLAGAFRVTDTMMPVSLEEAISYLYRIRCDVTHRGNYFSYSLCDETGFEMITPDGNSSLVASIKLAELRKIILEGAILATRDSLPEDSECRGLLNL